MVQVIHADPMAFDMMLYQNNDRSINGYLQERFQQFTSALGDASGFLRDRAQLLYNQFNNNDLIQRTKAALRLAGGQNQHPNAIVSLLSLPQLQSAQVGMQRWIMAEPMTRSLYIDQRIDGYSDTYIDVYPGIVGERHYDYRRVMDGVVVEDPVHGMGWTEYPDDLMEGDRDLTFHEQRAILSTWNVAQMYAEALKEDHTNPFGGDIR